MWGIYDWYFIVFYLSLRINGTVCQSRLILIISQCWRTFWCLEILASREDKSIDSILKEEIINICLSSHDTSIDASPRVIVYIPRYHVTLMTIFISSFVIVFKVVSASHHWYVVHAIFIASRDRIFKYASSKMVYLLWFQVSRDYKNSWIS